MTGFVASSLFLYVSVRTGIPIDVLAGPVRRSFTKWRGGVMTPSNRQLLELALTNVAFGIAIVLAVPHALIVAALLVAWFPVFLYVGRRK